MDNRSSLRQRYMQPINRRKFLKQLGLAGVSLAAVPGMQFARAADKPTYFTWGGYNDDNFFGAGEVVTSGPFADKYGGPPNYAIFGDAEEGLTKMKAGFVVDAVHPCSTDVIRWRETGLFQAWDNDQLLHLNDIFPQLSKMHGAQDYRGQWFLPIEWGATSITYRTDLVDIQPEDESWEMLFDPRYKGKIAVIDSAADTWYCMAILAGVDLMQPMSDADIEKTNILMKKLRPQVRMFTNDMTSLGQALASGEVVMAISWNETPVGLWWEGHPVRFASPKEGTMTWFCGLMLHKDAPNYSGAHDIANSLTSPVTGQYLMENWGYGHANQKAFSITDPDTLAILGLDADPVAYMESGVFGIPQSDEVETRINRDFEAIKTGF
ncbi:MAG: ABC transporter [Acidiferrobacteraceae bacterium]|nr:ABC transporter [Acidiferrobacteraceae bacterium]|tara:strand:- start:826 stop:1965 length:1140 start_codon:yes stop_codon:yes gene_type:complete